LAEKADRQLENEIAIGGWQQLEKKKYSKDVQIGMD
jgi:hypothetical protein